MRLDTSLSDSIVAAARAASAKSVAASQKASSGQSSFKSALKAAASDSTTSSSSSSSSASAAETTQAVPGHLYSEILTGPRAGMYLNTSHNKRNGQAFVMVERNGVQYHVYGTGKNRTVVEMKRHTPAPTKTTTSTTNAGSVTPDNGTTPTTTTSGTSSTGVTAGRITTDTSTN
jgi:hypothetical protein